MTLCFDIGGSRIRAGRREGGKLVALGEVPTPLQDFAAFAAALASFMPETAPKGIALSIPGVVDPDTGRNTVANIPCISGLCLADELRSALGVPVVVMNDADCFALAEASLGAGRGHRVVLAIILGTGIGGGVVIDGRVVQGAGGYAGEWGHGPLLKGRFALPCGCGQTGCIDAVGGARGIERIHHILTGQHLSSHQIVEGWQSGASAESATVAEWVDILTGPLCVLINTLGASVVPVAGGLSNAPALLARLDQSVRQGLLRRTIAPLIIPAECGADAGLLGAALAGEAAFETG